MNCEIVLGWDPVLCLGDSAGDLTFEDDENGRDPEIADLSYFASSGETLGTLWTAESDELTANLIAVEGRRRSVDQLNPDVDVLLVGVMGEGVVEIDGAVNYIWPGTALLIPKGARRFAQATSARFAYLACRRPHPAT